jgi:hypothetical protein
MNPSLSAEFCADLPLETSARRALAFFRPMLHDQRGGSHFMPRSGRVALLTFRGKFTDDTTTFA